jgi:hypothetical protein
VEHLKDGAVTGPKLAAESVGSEHIVSEAINSGHIAPEAVTEEHLKDGSVTAPKLAERSVAGIHIQPGSIQLEHLAPELLENLQRTVTAAVLPAETPEVAAGPQETSSTEEAQGAESLEEGLESVAEPAVPASDSEEEVNAEAPVPGMEEAKDEKLAETKDALVSGLEATENVPLSGPGEPSNSPSSKSDGAQPELAAQATTVSPLQQFGAAPFRIGLEEDSVEVAVKLPQAYSDDRYSIVAMTNHPACYAVLKEQAAGSAVIEVVRTRLCPAFDGMITWIALGHQ